MRVSDSEREHVGKLLQRAVGQGMLTLGEFSERMDSAMVAKTRGELNAVLVDLPGMQIVGQQPVSQLHHGQYSYGPHSQVYGGPGAYPVSAPHSGGYPDLGLAGTGEPVLRARLSKMSRKGRWNVPASLRVVIRLSSTTLDFTQAIVHSPTVDLIVDDIGSSLTIIVPPETTVDTNGIDTIGAGVTNKVKSGPPNGQLHLVVRGSVKLGAVTVKYPFGTALRRLMG